MSNQEDGGKASTRGYQAQALVVLLDGLERTDWTSVAIEPERVKTDDGSMQMVDIRWMTGEEVLRYDQVKYTKNRFTLGDVLKITKKMNNNIPNTSIPRHLFLVGNLGDKLTDDSIIEGVVIHANPPLQRLIDVAAHCIDKYFPGFMADVRETSVTKISGILMANAGYSKTWTRPDLCSEIATQLKGTADQADQTGLTKQIRKARFRILTVIPEKGGHIAQYIIISATNTTPNLIMDAQLGLKFSETNSVQDIYYKPDLRGAPVGIEPLQDGNTHTLPLEFPGEFPPGATRTCGLHLRRYTAARPTSRKGFYVDPISQFTPTGQFQYDLTVNLPYCSTGVEVAPSAQYMSSRTIEFHPIFSHSTGQVDVSIQYEKSSRIKKSKENDEERMKRLLMSQFSIQLGLPPATGVPNNESEVGAELKRLQQRLRRR